MNPSYSLQSTATPGRLTGTLGDALYECGDVSRTTPFCKSNLNHVTYLLNLAMPNLMIQCY